MKFNSSYEVIKLIESKRNNGIELKQLKRFMADLGNPQDKLKAIHIGGTNGKGSTTNDVVSILMAAGYKVGMFTSPYLETHHDRMRINGSFIEDEFIVEKANKYYDEWLEYDLSMFEIDMFIAVCYFIEKKVDYAVFEVGLGGTNDATNILHPLVSAITNIGLDHLEYLGNTHLEITRSKSGIIKEGCGFVTSVEQPECIKLLEDVCKEHHVKLIHTKSVENIHFDGTVLTFDYRNFKNLRQHTLAEYQTMNISLAIEIIFYLRNHGLAKVKDTDIYLGIDQALWKGRFEILNEDPLVIVDGAHNEEGINALIESCHKYDKVRVLFSALRDKPTDKMIESLLKLTSDVTVCDFDFYRAKRAIDLARGHDVKIKTDWKQAVEEMWNGEGLFLICGSLYFISQVREYILENKKAESQ